MATGAGELEADTTLESDYILLHALLGTGNQERFRKAANWIIQHQNEDGGWSIYASGPSNVSASVKAYFGLKLAGYSAIVRSCCAPTKRFSNSAASTEVNTFTKIYLCFFGQYDYDAVPAIPPEIVLFPIGSGSTSTRFRRGRAPSWSRSRSPTPRSPSKNSPRNGR